MRGHTAASAESDGEGAASAVVARCGPPQAPASVAAQPRCMQPEQLAEATTHFVVKNVENDPSKWTYELVVGRASSQGITFLFATTQYDSKVDAEEGIGALLRAALTSANLRAESYDGSSYFKIVAGNGRELARSTLFTPSSTSLVGDQLRAALDAANVDVISQPNVRERWSIAPAADGGPTGFALIAGNGQRVLFGKPVRGGSAVVEEAIATAQGLGARDYEAATRVDASTFCETMPVDGGLERRLGKSFRITYNDTTEASYSVTLVRADGSLLASGAKDSRTCQGAVDQIRAVTRILQALPPI